MDTDTVLPTLHSWPSVVQVKQGIDQVQSYQALTLALTVQSTFTDLIRKKKTGPPPQMVGEAKLYSSAYSVKR